MLKDLRFECADLSEAICPERDTEEAIVVDPVSKQAMELHLQAVSAVIPSGSPGAPHPGPGPSPLAPSLMVSQKISPFSLFLSTHPELTPQEMI